MKCAGPVACSNQATWWIASPPDAGLHRKMARCDLHVAGEVLTCLQRRPRAEVRVVPLPAWN